MARLYNLWNVETELPVCHGSPRLGYCIDMSIRLFPLLIVVIATGASSLAEELPATEVTRIVRHLMELAWGEELSRIRYVSTIPSGGSQSVVTKLIEIQGQNKRWEIVETDEDRVKTMVIGANAQYAFYAEQPAIGEPWRLMDFLPEEISRQISSSSATATLP